MGYVQFDTTIQLQGTEGQWRAFITPPGVCVRAETRDEILVLASEASDGLVQMYSKKPDYPEGLIKYLESRNVPYEISEPQTVSQTVAGPQHIEEIVLRRSPKEAVTA